MGQKSSKQQSYPWPPPGAYQGPVNPYYNPHQPYTPPGYPHQYPQQHPAYMPPVQNGPYVNGRGSMQMPQPQLAWMPQQKREYETKKRRHSKRTQSEQYPSGFIPSHPQPVVPPAPSPYVTGREPVVPPAPAGHSRPSRRTSNSVSQPTSPAFVPPSRDSDETSTDSESYDDEDDEPSSRRRSSRRRRRHRPRARAADVRPPPTGNIEDVLQPQTPPLPSSFGPIDARPRGPLNNPLPEPPRDLYDMSPWKAMLKLPNTGSLLTATIQAQNASGPVPLSNTTVIVQPTAPANVVSFAPDTTEGTKKKKGGIFRRFSTKKEKKPQVSAPAPTPEPTVQFVPIFLPPEAKPGPAPAPPQQPQQPPQSRASMSAASAQHPVLPTVAQTPSVHPQAIQTPAPVIPATPAHRNEQPFSAGLTTGGNSTGTPRSTFPNANLAPSGPPPLRFNQTDPVYHGFMNHSPHRIMYGSRIYPTATHLHEAMKYLDSDPIDPSNPNAIPRINPYAERIRTCPDVLEVYRCSSDFASQARPDWTNVFMEKLDEVLNLKFSQHPDLRQKLVDTWPRTLIYSDPHDDFWGDGPMENGINELGRVLMRVRERLLKEATDP